jgi:hypothetical protein
MLVDLNPFNDQQQNVHQTLKAAEGLDSMGKIVLAN